MVTKVTERLLSWASDIDEGTIQQASRASRLPIVANHVALMPDAHVGIGATVGSVIPTENAIIPSAVGVDLGCGMVAAETNLTSAQLPDDHLAGYLSMIERAIPAGVGKGHLLASPSAVRFMEAEPHPRLTERQRATAMNQFGTLGSGNHFFEVCLDERDRVWLVLHSGSRGIGNQLASAHIKVAREMAKAGEYGTLEDPDLAWFTQGTERFQLYIQDMLWAQVYAYENRAAMMTNALTDFSKVVGKFEVTRTINCHHNFAALEEHDGRKLWITRKGAIKADVEDWGVIPGSMGTRSYIVKGKGSAASWKSCSHGAGRRMSRSKAKKELTVASLAEKMAGKVWLSSRGDALVDEHPDAYKDIDQVMADQQDLVEVQHELRQVLNYKGV